MKTGDHQKKPTPKPKWQWGIIFHLGVKSDSSCTLFPCTFCIIATKVSELKKKKAPTVCIFSRLSTYDSFKMFKSFRVNYKPIVTACIRQTFSSKTVHSALHVFGCQQHPGELLYTKLPCSSCYSCCYSLKRSVALPVLLYVHTVTHNVLNCLFVRCRLLAQLDETENAFEQFWSRHHLKLEQCLQLRHFEQDFKEVLGVQYLK